MQPPKSLIVALVLLALAHAYGIVELVRVIGSGFLDIAPTLPSMLSAVVYALLLWLLVLVWRGHDWARLLCAVAAFLALALNAPHLPSFGVWAFGWFIAKAVGLALLYVPPTNRWFRSAGPNNSSKPTPLRGAA